MADKPWLAGQVDILRNLAGSLLPVQELISASAYIMGIAFAFKAIYALKAYGEARTMMSSNTSMKEPLLYLVVAAIFIYFPTGLSIILTTTFGNGNIMAYQSVDSENQTLGIFGSGSAAGPYLALLIQTVGGIAFIRGWVLIARSAAHGQQPGGTGKGIMHVFGGILAMNIVETLQIVNNTLYGA